MSTRRDAIFQTEKKHTPTETCSYSTPCQTQHASTSIEVKIDGKEDTSTDPTVIDISSPARSDGSETGESICCRICMEAVKEEEFSERRALRLGCKCRDGMDVVHLKCAKKWFRLKRTPDCEICGAAASALPERLQKELNLMKEQQSHVFFSIEDEEIAPPNQRSSFSSWIFVAFCLLPALLSAGILIMYLHWTLQTETGSAIVLAAALAVVTSIHWITSPCKRTWHILFVIIHLFAIILTTSVFRYYYGWHSISSTAAGCFTGSITSIGIYCAVRSVCLICFAAVHQWGSRALVQLNIN